MPDDAPQRDPSDATAPGAAPVEPDSTPPSPEAPAPEQQAQIPVPDVLPVLRTGASVLYPAIVVPLVTAEDADVRAVDDAVGSGHRMVAVIAQQPGEDGAYSGELQPVGTAAQILRMAKAPNGTLQALIQGVARIRVAAVEQREPWVRVRVERIDEIVQPG